MEKNNFDFLRFAFAFVVVLSHIVDLSLAPELKFLKPFFDTHISVTGFFIISGFLISASYLKSKSLSSYLIKRARRLLPAYLFVVLFSAVALSMVSSLPLNEYFSHSDFRKYLAANLFFVNFIQPCLPGVFLHNIYCSINGALWTIKVEVTFYLVLPLLLYPLSRIKRPNSILVAYYLLGLIYQYGCFFLALLYPARASFFETLQHQMPGFLTYFTAGILLYLNRNWVESRRSLFLPLSIFIFCVEYYFQLEILRPMAMAILIMFFAYGFKPLNNFGMYGDFSYGIYIFHFPLIQLFTDLHLFEKYNPFLVAILLIFLLITLAVSSWNFLEKRFLKSRIH
ncbi:MAG: acyltransferase [bacterium]|nr:acyltransferase [bacterium]